MTDTVPAVAIIIPCYNAQGTLAPTLDSALAQSFRDFVIVAVNDGSQDDTLAILEQYAKRHPDKIQVISQPNRGQTVAKNVGIANSRGEFIAFLDSDDLWAPDKLEKQLTLMAARPDTGLCYTAARQIDVQGAVVGTIGVSASHRGRCVNELILRNNIVASSVLARRAAIERAGLFDEHLRACENWDLWIRIARDYAVEFIDEPLTSYRVHPNNMSKNFERMFQARMYVIDKHLPQGDEDPELRERRREALFKAHLSFAKGYVEALRLDEARRELLAALKIRPADGECWVLFLKTLLGPALFRRLRAWRGRAA